MNIPQYIDNINQRYKLGNATEHTFRGDLQLLLESMVPDIRATNEPKRQKCGAPDYILTKKDIPVGFIEAKDIGDKDLEGQKKTGNKEQFDRYKASLNNLIFTDYVDFHFYKEGVFITKIAIGEIEGNKIKPLADNFSNFTNLIHNFSTHIGQTIKSSQKLAEMMASKARLLADIIERALISDEETHENSTLKDQMNAFKQILIHDITPKAFADVYSQTIAYGMFAARLHDATLPTFSRQEASELIPKSNPFLRKLFGYIAGPDIDDRIKWVVDSLVEIFLACNVEELLKNYGKTTKTEDPIIHFYETFLSEYDPKLRKARGVWYTPHPVVNFIVRAVDDILKTEFNLPMGIADKSKTKIKVNLQETDKRYKDNTKTFEQEVHRVQILDPATGTGTFLAEVIRQVNKQFEGQQGIWSNYVEKDLLPRLNGFELLMASYAMAHLQLDLLLKETGFKPTTDQRFRVYLTNSLEESHPDTGTLFANWLSSEANEANRIKRDTPVMCIIGNPPYSISSSNKSKWIEKLISDYKKDLNEKSYNSLSDDYVKFIRFGQYYIDKNGSGILAYISNNSFIDGIIHRQMRKHLLESFDKIYILDLHGNAKKKEVCPNGSPDQNVFDIMQGVSINIFIKTGIKKNNELGKILHYDLQGKREYKYNFLNTNLLNTIKWNALELDNQNYYYVNKNFEGTNSYSLGFKIDEIFIKYNNGIETGKDSFFYAKSKNELIAKIKNSFLNKEECIKLYEINNTDSFRFLDKFYKAEYNENCIKAVNYRPFDIIFCYYDVGLQRRPAYDTMKNIINDNLGLLTPRQVSDNFKHVFVTNKITDSNLTSTAKKFGSAPLFPLYIYNESINKQIFEFSLLRTPNLNLEIIGKISNKLGIEFTPEKEAIYIENIEESKSFAPIDILDYIYAVLYSQSYREKYKEFLKIDFPRVPYPKDKSTFWQLVKLGGELRETHLLDILKVNKFITQYPIDGDNKVTKVKYENGRVYINESQYFDNVPGVSWAFFIGGYQPAQKWLKDRKERILNFDDILHYQKIIVALFETDRIMKEIEKIEIE